MTSPPHSFRSVFLDPASDGTKVQWTAFGAATDWQAVSKGTRSPSTPSSASGVRDSTNGDLEQLGFGTIAGLVNSGEFVNWARAWVYFNTAIPANQSVTVSVSHTANQLGQAVTVPAGTSGWWASPKLTPFTPGGTLLGPSSTPAVQLSLAETATQAANTEVTAVYYEVGLSTVEHLVPSGSRYLGASSSRPYKLAYSQYASLVFDAWMSGGATAGNRAVVTEMVNRGLNFCRCFIPFGDMMIDAATPDEAKWVLVEEWLDMCVEEGLRVDITGLETFLGPGTSQVPAWLDIDNGDGTSTPVLTEAQRNATFALWWNRCAKACAHSPAVVLLDIVNEPIAPASQSDWYIGTGGFRFGTFLCINRGARTDSQVFSDFHDQMRTEIRKWMPKKPTAMAEHGSGGDGFPDPGELATHGEAAIPHMYLASNSSMGDWLAQIDDTYRPLSKPILQEEGGLTGSNQPYGLEEVVAFAIALDHRGVIPHGGWKGLFDGFDKTGVRIHERTMPAVLGRIPQSTRVAGVRASSPRIGAAFA